jgi:hypothetical protein
MAYTTPGAILFRYIPGVGRVAVNSCGTSSSAIHGNVAIVDAVLGNDSTASVSGNPFKTITAAVQSVSSGQSVWILPGTYTITSPIVVPSGVSIRGLSLQTTVLRADVTSSFTMLTMGEGCRVEDLTLTLNCTGSTNNVVLKGVVFGGTSSQTSKLRVCVVTVNNSTMSRTLTSTVTAVEFNGTGALTSSTFSFNSIKGSTINVISNGAGNKRGLLISNSNQASTRDTNIYVATPSDTASTGSYVGVETNDTVSSPNPVGSIQLRSTTIGVGGFASSPYTASDILQTKPATISDPTYLASSGIQVGPGTDLVTKSAGGFPFSTFVYPTIVYYGLKGDLRSGTAGYLWPGTQAVSAGTFPDATTPPAYFRVQQPLLLSGMYASLNIAPGGANSVTLTVYQNGVSTGTYTTTISGTATFNTFYNGSVRFNTGDYLSLYVSYTGGGANLAHDLTVQLDLF